MGPVSRDASRCFPSCVLLACSALLVWPGPDSAVASVPRMHAHPPRRRARGHMEWLPFSPSRPFRYRSMTSPRSRSGTHAVELEMKGRRGSAYLFSRSKPPHTLLTYAAAVSATLATPRRPKASSRIVMDLSDHLNKLGCQKCIFESLWIQVTHLNNIMVLKMYFKNL